MAFRKVKIPWKLKSLAFNIFDSMPMGEYLYYLTQKNVTKTIPRDFIFAREVYTNHINTATKYFQYLGAVRVLEVGAGWDLYSNILNYVMGFNDQMVIDVRRLARAESINEVIMHFRKHPIPGAVRTAEFLVRQRHMDDDLERYYGIKYLAPKDARDLPISDASIDMISTSSVLEHIPTYIIEEIFEEFSRVIHRNGICSHLVDYSDHYAHSDPNISNFNFCTMSAREWRRHNPGIHFQNRMRHSDYVSLFKNAGFAIAEEEPWRDSATVDTSRFHGDFLKYARDDVLILRSKFVLTPTRPLQAPRPNGDGADAVDRPQSHPPSRGGWRLSTFPRFASRPRAPFPPMAPV